LRSILSLPGGKSSVVLPPAALRADDARRAVSVVNNTLIKGLALLEALARADRPLGVTELAQRLELGKSNVHRLLQALVDLGYARRDDQAGAYAATIRVWEIGQAMLSNLNLTAIAEPQMERLLRKTRETVHLSVLDGDEVVYLHKLDSPEAVRAYTTVGGRAPAYCVATGKAMLAFRRDEHLQQLARRLKRSSPRTITDPEEFLREMARVRSQGCAFNRGEWRESVGGVGAPIRDPAGQVVAAIGLSGPIDRLRPAVLRSLAGEVVAAAQAVGRALAGSARPGAAGRPGA
jgi:DNA-binding IclR family transcriptional regulator